MTPSIASWGSHVRRLHFFELVSRVHETGFEAQTRDLGDYTFDYTFLARLHRNSASECEGIRTGNPRRQRLVLVIAEVRWPRFLHPAASTSWGSQVQVL
jgi:hypothetical protein